MFLFFRAEKVNAQTAENLISAQLYPTSSFIGVDYSEEAIKEANNRLRGHGFDNLEFLQRDGKDLPKDWIKRFDLVTMFDSCHDMTRPDLVNFWQTKFI